MSIKVDSYTIEEDEYGGFVVYGHGDWSSSSVMAGRRGRRYMESFDSLEEAKVKYPDVELSGNTKWLYDTDPGPIAPSWFDPGYAGERWDSDY